MSVLTSIVKHVEAYKRSESQSGRESILSKGCSAGFDAYVHVRLACTKMVVTHTFLYSLKIFSKKIDLSSKTFIYILEQCV